jgi:hypothetical protein
MIKYKIIEVNEAEHSIVVRYYTDKIAEEDLASDILDGVIRRCRTDYSMDLPIPAPIETELHNFIMDRAPVSWLNTKESVLDPMIDTSLLHYMELIGKEVVADI